MIFIVSDVAMSAFFLEDQSVFGVLVEDIIGVGNIGIRVFLTVSPGV